MPDKRYKRLIIAEKPSLARSIAAAIGGGKSEEGYIDCGQDAITWCVGHLLEMAPPDAYGAQYAKWDLSVLPIVPDQWTLLPKKDVKSQIEVIRRLLSRSSSVVHAGDPDREGQLLVDELLDYLGCRLPVERVWLQDLTPEGIRSAMGKLKPNGAYANLCAAAKVRARADWLLGMNMTRAYTLLAQAEGFEGVLHVGRVQTPTLGLVVARDRAIESFVPKDYFIGLVRFRHANGEFVARWEPREDAGFLDEEGRIKDRSAVEAMVARVAGQSGKLSSVKTERKRENPPLPYTLADLQKDANRLLGLSPQQTLDVAQSLYERHKLTTYPRTDCPYLPEAEQDRADEVVGALRENFASTFEDELCPLDAIDTKRRSPAWNDAKLGAHHGIIPTARRYRLSELGREELFVYGLIVRRYLAQFLPEYQYDSTRVVAEVDRDRFVASGVVVFDLGWKILFKGGDEADREKDAWSAATPLPDGMREGDGVRVLDTHIRAEKTKPPKRFDGASLIEAMQKAHLYVKDPGMRERLKEAKGIGTEATRASIIENLISRGYIVATKKSRGKGEEFHSSEKGRALIDLVSPKLAEVDLTAWFEARIEGVLEGRVKPEACESEMVEFVRSLVLEAQSNSVRLPESVVQSGPKCPACSRPMKARTGKHGAFWGCTGYPECKQTLPMDENKPKTNSVVYSKKKTSRGKR